MAAPLVLLYFAAAALLQLAMLLMQGQCKRQVAYLALIVHMQTLAELQLSDLQPMQSANLQLQQYMQTVYFAAELCTIGCYQDTTLWPLTKHTRHMVMS